MGHSRIFSAPTNVQHGTATDGGALRASNQFELKVSLVILLPCTLDSSEMQKLHTTSLEMYDAVEQTRLSCSCGWFSKTPSFICSCSFLFSSFLLPWSACPDEELACKLLPLALFSREAGSPQSSDSAF